MKYGQQLLSQQYAKWSNSYINYGKLKKRLAQECKALQEALDESLKLPNPEDILRIILPIYNDFNNVFYEELKKVKYFYEKERDDQASHLFAIEVQILRIKDAHNIHMNNLNNNNNNLNNNNMNNNNMNNNNNNMNNNDLEIGEMKSDDWDDDRKDSINTPNHDDKKINEYLKWKNEFFKKNNLYNIE
eukprot:GHVL01000549.1.p1 GENE.GHVL01000549.1~~GHVL01000549.1.p1  ORF type:complete len:188 (+),score=73.49 GHVL01000549.1:68-631(+)